MTADLVRTDRLAIDGGTPVRRSGRPWPRWPVPAPGAAAGLAEVLDSGRWAISSRRDGELFERRFAERFARYLGARHCVPTDHGSSALVIALESLGLRYGDPVLVPALTWVASASAVLRAGLVPVLADVDADTGCVSAATLDLDVPARAAVVVHWACAMADVPAIAALADRRGMSVIEDAAQAHGARWDGRAAGTLGRLGCFSMQHAKTLSCGEGGAVVTDDDGLATVLEELRADSRSYRGTVEPGQMELRESASILGSNFCLGEFAAAVLCAQLDVLDEQHAVRNRNYALMARHLAAVPGVRLLRHDPRQDRLSLYEVPIVFEELPETLGNDWVAAALGAELGTHVYPPRTPLNDSPLLRPSTKSVLGPLAERFEAFNGGRAFPAARALSARSVVLHHSAFLGDASDMTDLAEAVAKVAERVRIHGH